MSTKPKKKGHSQTHQNKDKWRHNPNSVLTKKILLLDHYCLCYRCEAQIEWRKTYRKYKPLKAMRRCNACQEHAINRAYHTFCNQCALARGICAKCGKTYDITNKQKPVEDNEMLDALKIADIKERFKRTILRNWEKGLFVNRDILQIIDLLLKGEQVVWEDWQVQEDEEDCCGGADHTHNHAPKMSKGAMELAARQKLDLTELLPEDTAVATTTTTTTTQTPAAATTTTTTTPAPEATKDTEAAATTSTTTPAEPAPKKKITILPTQTTSRVGAMSAAMPTANKKK